MATSSPSPTLECDARLVVGTAVHIRPIDPSDAGRLVEFHGRLSTRTTWLRFFSVHPQLSPRDVVHVTMSLRPASDGLS